MQRVLFFLLIFLGYDCDVFFWLETMLWRAKSSLCFDVLLPLATTFPMGI